MRTINDTISQQESKKRLFIIRKQGFKGCIAEGFVWTHKIQGYTKVQ